MEEMHRARCVGKDLPCPLQAATLLIPPYVHQQEAHQVSLIKSFYKLNLQLAHPSPPLLRDQ